MVEVLGAIAAAIAIATAVIKGGGWTRRKLQERRQRRETPPAENPVRLICEDASEFHQIHGSREGFRIEVYNDDASPVQIKGFGLVLGMQGQGSWERLEAVSGYPLSSFPRWLKPREGFEGYIDAEALSDQVYTDGEDNYWVSTHAYVDVSGHPRKLVDPQTGDAVEAD